MNLILIGYRGTGKSTVARLLAGRLGWPCVDSDLEIEREAGATIAEIFSREGEAGFRQREAAVVARLLQTDHSILSLGGGAILNEATRQQLPRAGHVVWLSASAEIIHARLTADPATESTRPNLTPSGGLEEIRKMLQQRQALYEECAEVKIDTGVKSPAAVADEIVQHFKLDAAQD